MEITTEHNYGILYIERGYLLWHAIQRMCPRGSFTSIKVHIAVVPLMLQVDYLLLMH